MESLWVRFENMLIETYVRDDLINWVESKSGRDKFTIPNAPDGWKPQTATDDWTPDYKNNTNVPKFEPVDNPGGSSEYTFSTKCSLNSNFVRFSMPSGVKPVPLSGGNGKPKYEWEFSVQVLVGRISLAKASEQSNA